MKNNTMKNTAVALAIALPLLTIGLLVNANEPTHITSVPGTASEQASEAASTAAKTAEPKSETSINTDKCTQSRGVSANSLIPVDFTAQRAGVFSIQNLKKCSGNVCSTEVLGSQAPTGRFRIQNRGTWF
jgi:hypothetical protein